MVTSRVYVRAHTDLSTNLLVIGNHGHRLDKGRGEECMAGTKRISRPMLICQAVLGNPPQCKVVCVCVCKMACSLPVAFCFLSSHFFLGAELCLLSLCSRASFDTRVGVLASASARLSGR